MASKKKTVSAVVAVALAAAILLGGTFAWQSISQEALNEVYGFVNPGGRLHDDFHEITYDKDGDVATDPATGNAYETRHFDKNVYVENFTTMLEDGVQIFARVRLDEYMEIGAGAGTTGEGNKSKSVDTTNPDATFENMKEWRTRLPSDTDNPFQKYWDWTMAGQGLDNAGNVVFGQTAADGVYYMPTFNMNKDSLVADINGTFDGPNGQPDKEDAFDDYVEYTIEEGVADGIKIVKTKEATAIYDADDDTVDDVGLDFSDENLQECVSDNKIKVETKKHDTKKTLGSAVITMDQWRKLLTEHGGYDAERLGNYWVWDEDGWAYWTAPIDPSTATGVFLDGTARTETIINEEWYYGINVVAQFITVDDLGSMEDGTGFYNTSKGGTVPSFNALQLLATLGVQVNTKVDNAEKLVKAFEQGGNIDLGGSAINAPAETVEFANFDVNFFWHTGGTLRDGTLMSDQEAYACLFINSEKNWPKDNENGYETDTGANAATVEDVKITTGENVRYGIYIQPYDNDVTLNNVIVESYNGGIYAEYADSTVTINNATVTAASNFAEKDWVNTALAVANNANMEVNGGIYEGKYAAYVYSSGGTITINDGKFYGALKVDAGTLIIKGGVFNSDPTDYLADGYKAVLDSTTNMWTVSLK